MLMDVNIPGVQVLMGSVFYVSQQIRGIMTMAISCAYICLDCYVEGY